MSAAGQHSAKSKTYNKALKEPFEVNQWKPAEGLKSGVYGQVELIWKHNCPAHQTGRHEASFHVTPLQTPVIRLLLNSFPALSHQVIWDAEKSLSKEKKGSNDKDR